MIFTEKIPLSNACYGTFSENNGNKRIILSTVILFEMFSYIDGSFLSYNIRNLGYCAETAEYGDIKLYISSPDVENIKTEGGQNLAMSVTYTIIDDENPENIGINQILI